MGAVTPVSGIFIRSVVRSGTSFARQPCHHRFFCLGHCGGMFGLHAAVPHRGSFQHLCPVAADGLCGGECGSRHCHLPQFPPVQSPSDAVALAHRSGHVGRGSSGVALASSARPGRFAGRSLGHGLLFPVQYFPYRVPWSGVGHPGLALQCHP